MKTKVILERPALMPLPEAMHEFDISRATLTRWAKEGVIKTVKVGGRVYVPRSELDRVLAGK